VAEDQNILPDQSSYTRTSPNSSNYLNSLKSYGTLIVPSPSVVKIVQVTDKILRERLHQWHLMKKESLQVIKQQVLPETKPSTFTSLEQHYRGCHILDQNLRDDHIIFLIHSISDFRPLRQDICLPLRKDPFRENSSRLKDIKETKN
jgi:hypothetical protein